MTRTSRSGCYACCDLHRFHLNWVPYGMCITCEASLGMFLALSRIPAIMLYNDEASPWG
jgi:hypothetical protein